MLAQNKHIHLPRSRLVFAPAQLRVKARPYMDRSLLANWLSAMQYVTLMGIQHGGIQQCLFRKGD